MSRPRLILIPGWNIKSEIFKPYVQELQDTFELIYFDPPQVTQNAYSIATTELKKLITPNTWLMGWSMGGQLAILTASEKPLRGLFILNSAAVFSNDAEAKKSFYNQCQNNFPKAIKYFHRLMGDLSIEESLLFKKNFLNNQSVALAYLQELHNQDLTENAQKISVPTFIFHTTGDQIIPFTSGERLAKIIPSSYFFPLESKNHFPFINACATILNKVRSVV